MIFRQYNPLDNVLVWGGITMLGYADDSMIVVAQAEDDFEMVPGAAGDVVLVRNQNPTGSITFRLQAESPVNDLLSARAVASRKFRPFVAPATVTNLNSTMECGSTFAVLARVPDIEQGATAGVREWRLLCADLEMFAGGAIL